MPDQDARPPVAALEAFALIGLSLALTVLAALIGGPLRSIAVYQLVCLGAPLAVLASRSPSVVGALGVAVPRPAWILLVAAVAGVVVLLVNLTAVLPNSPWSSNASPKPLASGSVVLAIAIYAVVPAIIEELVFRGVLLRAIARHHRLLALVVSAVVFAAFHLSLARFLPTLVLGLVAGALVLASGSVWPAIVLHVINNTLVVVLVRAQDAVSMVERVAPVATVAALVAIGLLLAWLTRQGPRRT